MFITFEGPEGCGKSTHARELKTYLEALGYAVLVTREPGGTLLGQEIRGLLLCKETVIEKQTEVFLFAADRCEHVNRVILPALKEGKIVISDRFIDSTFAYQVGGRGLPLDMVQALNAFSSNGLVPDLTVLLDVSPETGIGRAAGRSAADRFEKEGMAFHQRIREYYLKICHENPGRVKLVDSEGKGLEETQKMIREIIDEKLGK